MLARSTPAGIAMRRGGPPSRPSRPAAGPRVTTVNVDRVGAAATTGPGAWSPASAISQTADRAPSACTTAARRGRQHRLVSASPRSSTSKSISVSLNQLADRPTSRRRAGISGVPIDDVTRGGSIGDTQQEGAIMRIDESARSDQRMGVAAAAVIAGGPRRRPRGNQASRSSRGT